jgi:energy-coupling factor transport system ATP-binding protein
MSIKIVDLTHIYDKKTPNETIAVDHINLDVATGEFIGLIGHTGSGKSTLIQQLNGLLKPSSGEIIISGYNITDGLDQPSKKGRIKKSEINARKKRLIEVRKRVGLVFQYPEYQLFEETVEKDISFGPVNLGLGPEEVTLRVIEAMRTVGLDYETYKDRSPFELSGGQKRRVAIAGVLAMKPEVLILDEPTAGLDPRGRDEILAQIKTLHLREKITVIIVSHSMEDMAKIAERLIVMNKGTIVLDGTPKEVFRHIDLLEEIGLAVPQISYLIRSLVDHGFNIDSSIITVEEAKESLIKIINKKSQV